MSVIEIEKMTFYAYHGCYHEEAVVGNYFEVYVSLEVDSSAAEISDDVADTVSYLEVYQVIKEQMEIRSNILEHVGRRILDSVKLRFPSVGAVTVRLSKMNPPLGGQIEKVTVVMSA